MRKKIKKLIIILIGTFILSLSVEQFIIPNAILSGGVAGIAVALEPFFHWNETIAANSITLIFLLMGRIVLGREFTMNTIVSSLAYPVFTTLCSYLPVPTGISMSVASLYAGLLGGIGIGMVMTTGASTGGVDVPTLILAKVLKTKVSTMVLIVDGCTVLLGVLAYDLSAALIGLISVFVSSYTIDKVLSVGQGSAKSVQIISDHWREIKDRIGQELDRGVTVLDAHGGFSGEEKNVLLCVVSKHQYALLLEIIHEYDERAFVITTEATDMHGEGFTIPVPRI